MISNVLFWILESQSEQAASERLSRVCDCALSGQRKMQNYLKKLWGEGWPEIKEKLQTDGSAWDVWWMDGVRQHIENLKRD